MMAQVVFRHHHISAYNLYEFLWYMLGYPRIVLLEFSLILRLRYLSVYTSLKHIFNCSDYKVV